MCKLKELTSVWRLILRCFVHSCPSQWKEWLSLAKFWYNTSYHSTLVNTPFEVLYGQDPTHLNIETMDNCVVPNLKESLNKRKLMTSLLQQYLQRAQQRMKRQADKNRSQREFQVGEWVFLKLKPNEQSSVAMRSNHKLSFR